MQYPVLEKLTGQIHCIADEARNVVLTLESQASKAGIDLQQLHQAAKDSFPAQRAQSAQVETSAQRKQRLMVGWISLLLVVMGGQTFRRIAHANSWVVL